MRKKFKTQSDASNSAFSIFFPAIVSKTGRHLDTVVCTIIKIFLLQMACGLPTNILKMKA